MTLAKFKHNAVETRGYKLNVPDEPISQTEISTPKEEELNPLQQCHAVLSKLPTDEVKALIHNVFSEEVEQLKKRVQDEAFEQGFKRGQEEAQKRGAKILEEKHVELENAIKEWALITVESQSRKEISVDSEETLLKIIHSAIEKVLGLIFSDAELVAKGYQDTISSLSNIAPKKLLLSPQQYASLMQSKVLKLLDEHFVIEADESLAPGNFHIELDAGSIEHSFEHSYREITEMLKVE